jgi:hypothetical protein
LSGSRAVRFNRGAHLRAGTGCGAGGRDATGVDGRHCDRHRRHRLLWRLLPKGHDALQRRLDGQGQLAGSSCHPSAEAVQQLPGGALDGGSVLLWRRGRAGGSGGGWLGGARMTAGQTGRQGGCRQARAAGASVASPRAAGGCCATRQGRAAGAAGAVVHASSRAPGARLGASTLQGCRTPSRPCALPACSTLHRCLPLKLALCAAAAAAGADGLARGGARCARRPRPPV